MKKCPFCGADIADNARFCMFCMTSFNEKEVISGQTKRKKWWLIVSAAVLSFLLVGGVWFAVYKKEPEQTDSGNITNTAKTTAPTIDGTNAPNNTETTAKDIDKTDASYDNKNKPLKTKNERTTAKKSAKKSTNKQNNQPTANKKNNFATTPKTTIGNKIPTAGINTTLSKTTKKVAGVDRTTSGKKTTKATSGNKTTTTESVTTPSPVTYTYEEATNENTYPSPFYSSYTPQNCVVITGVNSVAPDGVYVIPEKIDGKKVAAIMQSAFSDEQVSKSVKKVYLPATVRSIWETAFEKCYNLTDIYIKSEVICIYKLSFPDVSKRSGTLTIHCAKNCRDFDFYYYRNIVNKYDAVYEEWNG